MTEQVNYMTAAGRSSQVILKAAQEQGLSHAGKCVWHHAVGRDGSSVLSQGSCRIAGPPAWPALRLQPSDKLQPPRAQLATGCRALPGLGNGPLCRAPAMHRSCRFDLADHSLGAAALQHACLHWGKLNFAEQGKGEGKWGLRGTALCLKSGEIWPGG